MSSYKPLIGATPVLEIERFSRWLVSMGAEVLTPTNPYEILRVVIRDYTHVIYRNEDHTRENWPIPLRALHNDMKNGKNQNLARRYHVPRHHKSGGNRSSRVEALAQRDGWECWYCAADFDAPEQATVEELCPRQVGGPTHLHNQVLACEECNRVAGNRSVAEKVALRDKKRARRFGVVQPYDPASGLKKFLNSDDAAGSSENAWAGSGPQPTAPVLSAPE